MKKIDWRNHFIELIVVFLGLTAAFMLEQWKEDNKHDEIEREYLQSFHDDLVSDSSTVIKTITKNEQLLENTKGYEELLSSGKAKPDTAFRMLGILLSYNRFLINDATYNSMQNAGQLNLLSDAELRNQIVHYYHLSKQLDIIHDIHDYFLEDYAVPYQMNEMDIEDGGFIKSGAHTNDRFHNIISKLIAMVRVSNYSYKNIKEQNGKILRKVKEHLQ